MDSLIGYSSYHMILLCIHMDSILSHHKITLGGEFTPHIIFYIVGKLLKLVYVIIMNNMEMPALIAIPTHKANINLCHS